MLEKLVPRGSRKAYDWIEDGPVAQHRKGVREGFLEEVLLTG